MLKKEIQTEQKILEAARKVFQRSGIGGARMQEIADEAEINKASLHYYYRSKEKLFQTVFQEDFHQFMIPQFKIMRDPSLSLEERIRTFITSYSETMVENLHLPLFILHEISRNPDRLVYLVKGKMGMIADEDNVSEIQIPTAFARQIREGINRGDYHEVDPEQYIISLISMCVFPFAGRPMVKFFFNKDDEQYREFMQKRQDEIIDYAFRILLKGYQPGKSVASKGKG